MQIHKLGDALHNEYDPLIPSTFDKKIYYDDSMPPIYDDYNDESGFGRVSTLGNNDPTTLENDQSYEFFDKSWLGEVMTLFNGIPTMLEKCQLCMRLDHEENILCDGYYERGKYGCRNFHVAKLPLVILRLLLFLSSSLNMLDLACLANLFSYKIPMHRKYVRLKCVCHMFHYALFVF